MRRHTGPGRWRSTENTTRRTPGTHTVRRPDRRAATVAAATLSAVVANGAGASPSVIDVVTKPGRTTRTLAPLPLNESPRPWAKPSRPAFDEPYTKFARR